MSNGTNPAPGPVLELSVAEQWAVHSAVLDHVECTLEDEDPDPVVVLAVLEKIETGTFRFTTAEYERLRVVLEDYAAADDTPDVDRAHAAAVVEQIECECSTDVPR